MSRYKKEAGSQGLETGIEVAPERHGDAGTSGRAIESRSGARRLNGRRLPLATYRSLAEFRHQVRCFLRYSEDAARADGIEPQQHQLLLAIKGLPKGRMPTVGELADRLQIKHHSTVDLVDRLEEGGKVVRETGTEDRRVVLVRLTPEGERILRDLSVAHQMELTKAGPKLMRALAAAVKLARKQRSSKQADPVRGK